MTGRTKAFTLTETLVTIMILGLLAALLVPSLAKAKGRAQRISCVCNLKQIGLSFRQWGLDHTNSFPMTLSTNSGGTLEHVITGEVWRHFQVMSNELNTPRVLVCPSDRARSRVTDFNSFLSNTNISYFVGVEASDALPQMFLAGDRNITNHLGFRSGMLVLASNELAGWTHHLHNRQGNIALADGSVQGFSTSKLREALFNTGVTTNRLAMP